MRSTTRRATTPNAEQQLAACAAAGYRQICVAGRHQRIDNSGRCPRRGWSEYTIRVCSSPEPCGGGGNLLALVSQRPRRRAALVLGGSVVAFIVSVSLFIPDKPPEMAATPQVETVARPVRAPATAIPALPAKDEPLPNPTVGSPGLQGSALESTTFISPTRMKL
jgi:hypothetical protein